MQTNTPPPNLLQGIRLVEAGRRAEALAYLRLAAQSEPLTADGWMWLAAATDNLDEYRTCVQQALRLDPYHPVAGQMRRALEQMGAWSAAPLAPTAGDGHTPVQSAPAYQMGTLAPPAHGKVRRWRRILRVLVIALVLGGCLGVTAAALLSDGVQDTLRSWTGTESVQTLEFTVGGTRESYRFRVSVPESWLPADTEAPSWQDTRIALLRAFPDSGTLWEHIEAAFSRVVRDPVYGGLIPQPRLVETDAARLRADGMVAALTLDEIIPLPPASPGRPNTACERLAALEARFRADENLATLPNSEIVETRLVSGEGADDCVFVAHRRYTNQAPHQIPFALSPESAPTATREIVFAVPVGTERYASWILTFADGAYGRYEDTVTRIAETLRYVP